jgi:hypothetical protein
MDIRIKNYISWSQLELFERDPEEYRRVYINGGKRISFAPEEQEYGKRIADGLIEDNMTGDAEVDICRVSLPPVDQKDVEEIVMFGDIPLLIKCDGVIFDPLEVHEYKTGHPNKKGKDSWTQKKANEWRQLDFYMFAKFIQTGKIPAGKLILIPTIKIKTKKTDNWGNPIYRIEKDKNRELVVFPVKKTIADMALMSANIKRAWKGIGKMVEEEALK